MRRYGTIKFNLVLNTKQRTFFGIDEQAEQSGYCSAQLDNEISHLLDQDIQCSEKGENGTFTLKGLWCEFHKGRIVAHTSYLCSEDFPMTAKIQAEKYLQTLTGLVNESLKKHDVRFPKGQTTYDGSFWLPVEIMEDRRIVEWYQVLVEETDGPETINWDCPA